MITWQTNRGLASKEELDQFERSQRLHLIQDHRHFLMTIVNGGHPLQDFAVPTEDCPGGAGDLHGVFGVNNPEGYWDLATTISNLQHVLPKLIPFGFDQGSGYLFIDAWDKPGRLLYIPLEEMGDIPVHPYHVANSIAELFEIGPALAIELNEQEDVVDR